MQTREKFNLVLDELSTEGTEWLSYDSLGEIIEGRIKKAGYRGRKWLVSNRELAGRIRSRAFKNIERRVLCTNGRQVHQTRWFVPSGKGLKMVSKVALVANPLKQGTTSARPERATSSLPRQKWNEEMLTDW